MCQDSEKRPDTASSTASKALRSIQNFPSHTAVNCDCLTYMCLAPEWLCKDGNPSTKGLQTWEFVSLFFTSWWKNMSLPFLLAQQKHKSMQRLDQTENQLLKAGTLYLQTPSSTGLHAKSIWNPPFPPQNTWCTLHPPSSPATLSVKGTKHTKQWLSSRSGKHSKREDQFWFQCR